MSHGCELPRLRHEAEKTRNMFNTVRIPLFHLQITAKKTKVTSFRIENRVFSNKVCYEVSFCDNFQQQRCKAFTGLPTRAQMVGGNFQSIFAHSASTIAPTAPTKKVQFFEYKFNNMVVLYSQPLASLFMSWSSWVMQVGSQKTDPCTSLGWEDDLSQVDQSTPKDV